MKKRMLSLLLSVVMLVQLVPVYAFADARYEVRVNLNPSHDVMETQFREWAASLVEYYRSGEYAALVANSTAHTDSYINTLDRVFGGKWEQSKNLVRFDASVYAPYYKLAERKFEFDGSMDATGQNIFGMTVRYTYYTGADLMVDPGKANEIYEWLLIQTIKEKAELEPGFLTGSEYILPEDEKGWYSFDVSTGKMQYDATLRDVDIQSRVQAAESIAHSLVSLGEVINEGYNVYSDIKGAAADLVQDAANKLSDSVDFKKIGEDLVEDVIDTLVETVADTLDEALDQFTEQALSNLQNSIRNQLAIDLANNALKANKNVIGYLKTTYINQNTMLESVKNPTTHVEGFRDAAQRIIEALESTQAHNAAYSEAMEVMKHSALDMTGLKAIVPTEEILYSLTNKAIVQVVGGVLGNVQTALDSICVQLIDKKAGSAAQEYLKVVKDFLMTDIWNHFIKDGFVKGLDEGLKKHNAQELTSDGVVVFMSNTLRDIGEEIAKACDFENIDDFLMNCLIDRGYQIGSLVLEDILGSKSDSSNKAETGKAGEGTSKQNDATTYSDANVIKASDLMDKYTDGEFFSTKKVGFGNYAAIVIGLVMKDIISDYKNTVVKATSFMSSADQTALKSHLDALGKTLNSLSKKKFDKDGVVDYTNSVLSDMNVLLIWMLAADARYEQNLPAIMGESLSQMYDNYDTQKVLKEVADFFGTIVKSGDLWDLVIDHVSGLDVKKTESDAAMVQAYTDKYYQNTNNTFNPINTYRDFAEDVVEEVYSENKEVVTYLSTIKRTANAVWQKALDYGADFWVAVNDTSNALTGENLASLDAMRLYVTCKNSSTLESTLTSLTIGGNRTKRYDLMGEEGLAFYLDGGASKAEDGSISIGSNNIRMSMSPAEIRNPVITPDLKTIKALTDTILMQMQLDLVGMGAYITMLENRDAFTQTRFYEKHLNQGVFTTEYYAERCMLNIREGIAFENSYDEAWNSLFE